jgi:HlyD family secretion protein
MDIQRPELRRQRKLRRIAIGGAAAVLLALVTAGLAGIEPAAPAVSRESVWIGRVQRGEMLRQLSGPGTLVPREMRWIAAQSGARVDRIIVRAGATVEADTVIVQMSNPDLVQLTAAALYDLKAAEAAFVEARLKLFDEELDQKAALATARADHESTRMQREAEAPLAEAGIVAAVAFKRSQQLEHQLKVRMDAVAERLKQFSASMESRLDVQRAQVEQRRNIYERRLEEVESLRVRAGIAGVLQEVLVQEGQRIAVGANIARVARANDLSAQLQIPQTQAHEVQIDQRVRLDTRTGVVAGRIVRIDPAVQGGTVKVDVELVGELPRGLRPDLSVDGTIEIERLADVLYTGRPASAHAGATTSLYKLVDAGRYAVRVPVRVGRTSTDAIEILDGLNAGDQVILSDSAAWGEHARIHLTQ